MTRSERLALIASSEARSAELRTSIEDRRQRQLRGEEPFSDVPVPGLGPYLESRAAHEQRQTLPEADRDAWIDARIERAVDALIDGTVEFVAERVAEVRAEVSALRLELDQLRGDRCA